MDYVHISDSDLRILDLWSSGQWNLENIYSPLNQSLQSNINSYNPDVQAGSEVGWCWTDAVSKVYDAHSGYLWLSKKMFSWKDRGNWLWLWRQHVPEKHKFLAWLCLREALPTAAFRFKRGILHTDSCPRCFSGQESVLHCIRNCPKAQLVWQALGISDQPMDLMSWFLHNSKQHPFRFFSGLWWIWRSRNNEIFHPHDHWITDKVIGMALSLEKELRNIFELQRLSIPSTISGSWIPPSVGTFKINCDASYPGSGARVGFACVSRDWKGRWQRGCLGTIESRSILQGELFAIWRGFFLAWDSGQRDIICETDCVEAFTIVNNLQDCSGFIDPLVLKIQDIMSWKWHLRLILRDANTVADIMTKTAMRTLSPQVELPLPWKEFESSIQRDCLS
ncbi:uncharacterized protein LOC130934040 [Arachis stenosperma]|uniref:uncharacterized protein LOC130934040 n=1 Tax=Arachis stenosperma TaxID=217475 RepID=UPI0025AB630F|nr:uncharacterized protein LOC130934040 [Arachis stenosperma]